ncbi:NUDIX hydrolase [Pelomonas sp. APW6]|uniref:GDP-mannose pyrophosphatase n=1 Tax=Roseateles subflavus TaxID=3053353 RepID=A0ABT7LPP3_9BURK|nr:NUDIX hydrolase [Pelomonas sp. APW6]MDL5033476.1 NUDIX hydrolase [Pelomonas sp. APW6]
MKPDSAAPGLPAADDRDAGLVETRLRGEEVFHGRFLKVQCDTVRLPGGREATREFIRHPGAVMVVPLLRDGRLLLERQYRHPMGQVMLEFPAGKLDPQESPLACGRRELREETGYRAREWAYAGVLHNAIAYSDEAIHILFARDLIEGPAALDEGEFVECLSMSVEELDAACRDGRVTDAKTLIGLLWLQRWQQGAWPLAWQAGEA